MTIAWIVLLVGLAAAAAGVYRARRRRIDSTECGTVSDQWLAEQRAQDRHYSER